MVFHWSESVSKFGSHYHEQVGEIQEHPSSFDTLTQLIWFYQNNGMEAELEPWQKRWGHKDEANATRQRRWGQERCGQEQLRQEWWEQQRLEQQLRWKWNRKRMKWHWNKRIRDISDSSTSYRSRTVQHHPFQLLIEEGVNVRMWTKWKYMYTSSGTTNIVGSIIAWFTDILSIEMTI